MKKLDVEIVVGLFVFAGICFMAYTSVNLGQVNFFNNDTYPLRATFTSATGLKKDASVEISGVKVGSVKSVELENFQAIVTMMIHNDIEVAEDAIASIRTKGILGEQYVALLPGSSDVMLKPNGLIFDTEPPFDLLTVVKELVVGEE